MNNPIIVYQENILQITPPTLEKLICWVHQLGGCLLYTTPNTNHSLCRWIVGLVPMIVHKGLEIQTADQSLTVSPLHLIDTITEQAETDPECPIWIGYVGYDFKDWLEEPGLYQGLKDSEFDYCHLAIYRYVLEIDTIKAEARLYTLAVEGLDASFPELDFNASCYFSAFHVSNLNTNKNREQFICDVETIKKYIRAGDIYQANLTRVITGHFEGSVELLALNLLKSNNIEFGGFFSNQGKTIISTSPERFFKVEGNRITTSPIKGTIPRTDNEAENQRRVFQLTNDTKNRRELAMIVDLLRNDLSRVCLPGSVTVNSFPELIALNNVYHLVAHISGQLGKKSFETIAKALFPGGSISGCPKIRACQIIEELEKIARGPYTGMLGYIRKNQDMDFNILIRTVMLANSKLRFNVGGGITLLSDPDDEFMETCHKARNILATIQPQK